MATRFGYYVVGVFDVLGQKRKLADLPGRLNPTGGPQDEVMDYLTATVGEVLRLRALFQMHFDLFTKEADSLASTPGVTADAVNLLTPSFRHWGFSDTYVVAVPPSGGRPAYQLLDVYRMLGMSASVWLLAMRRDLPIRGGIEFGLAMDVGEQEVYGYALAQAHRLESKVAQYPRIVVGPGLLVLLNRALEDTAMRGQDVDLAHRLAEMCMRLIQTDEDEALVVDVTSRDVLKRLPETLPEAVVRSVEQQLQRHRDARNAKLQERYQRLQRSLVGLYDAARS